ncbi:MAG: DUF4301 family protein [Bacteroidetes bacterium]|nr:MAG: DUF4301 family protein [Bacteroidota bacterium]
MFTQEDLLQLNKKGISEETALEQIRNFEEGFPFIQLAAPATISSGILKIEGKELKGYINYFEEGAGKLGILKFVPASGAATRMFKDLFSWREKLQQGISAQVVMQEDKTAVQFFQQIKLFAFWEDLSALINDMGMNADELVEKGDYLPLLNTLLDDDGLGYAMLPKGLLKFHRYEDSIRTPVEEHLVEGAQYACDNEGTVKLHFTVSSEHRGRFVNHVGDILKVYEGNFGYRFEIKFSVQKPSTDTLAVDLENKPFREADNSLLFRPGGHGALIQNLNEIKEDVVFIKNIDNVVPDSLKDQTYQYKKALGGMLIQLLEKIHGALKAIDDGTMSLVEYAEMRSFAIEKLFIDPKLLPEGRAEGIPVMKDLLNRPVRICGMVKNVGEPGGGPFWVENPNDKTRSLQIVESSQVNQADPHQKEIFEKATHFNPVDLVCGLKDYRGEAFDLLKYVEPSTGFISQKSKDGRELKAQELPGLWNGAMANWITLFVEVPLATFNPVKTIMDLLRKEHM